MSIATKQPEAFIPDDPKVYHPLDRLRGIIRRYVVIEGLLSAAVFLAAWFALALVLDYGVFKVLTWDWVQDATWWLRAFALFVSLGLLGAIVVYRIVKRLTTELTYPALALVLERRFRLELGDRLITAVELADVKEAARYGYSTDMIRQTIGEARERVGTVPVHEAFNWGRLYAMGGIAAGILLTVLVGAVSSHAVAVRGFQPGHAAWKFYHVSSILAERNLLLMNTPWPRRALLELDPSIKETGIRVARDGSPPKLKVKSYRWVVADRSNRDGWRPLKWADVGGLTGTSAPDLPVSALRLPEDKGVPTEAADWTLDMVWDRARENPTVRDRLSTVMGAGPYQDLQHVLDQLEEMADSPANERTLRRLNRPEAVTFEYAGALTGGGGPLNLEGNSEYAGEIGGLREDVTFVVKAEDFRTPPRAVTLIPPPALVKLMRIEYQPAYLYYPPPLVPSADKPGEMTQLGPSSLQGKLQTMVEEKLSLTGDRSTFVAPAGTEVVITGTTELPIARAFVLPRVGKVPGAKPGSAALVPLPLSDENTFSISFRGADRLTSSVEFDLLFENEDKVQSTRKVLIQVTEDNSPVVEVVPEFVRRVGTSYYVTPRAKIPFNPDSTISDDNGLSKVEYTASWSEEESPAGRARRCITVTQAILAPVGLSAASVIQGAYHTKANREAPLSVERKDASFGLGSFYAQVGKVAPDTVPELERKLATPRKAEKADLIKRVALTTDLRPEPARSGNGKLTGFRWRIDGDYFDVSRLNLEETRRDVQPRYAVQLNIRATDTNCDTGPKATSNSEAIRLLVVSSADLLYEISKDEEALLLKLDDAIKKLELAKRKYEYVRSKNGYAPPEDLDSVKVRSKDSIQDIAKAREAVQTVLREYRRIEKECIYNQLEDRVVSGYGAFANWIDRILGETPAPVGVQEEQELDQRAGRGPIPSFPSVEKLTNLVQTALDEGRWADLALVTDTAIALTALHTELTNLRARGGEGQTFDKVKNEVTVILDQQRRVLFELRALEKRWTDDQLKDYPSIASVGPVFLRKGETNKIQHKINWRQFKEDTFTIKVSSSDPAGVVVPAELKLDFEKNDLSFDYEIRAGNKEGDFTVTLTPAVGPKVEVKVSVK